MKTITIIPKNEEVVPFLEQLLSSMDCVSDFRVNENGAENNNELKENNNELKSALGKINKQYGNVLKKLAE